MTVDWKPLSSESEQDVRQGDSWREGILFTLLVLAVFLTVLCCAGVIIASKVY